MNARDRTRELAAGLDRLVGHPRQEARREEARELAALLSLDFCVSRGRDTWLARLVNGPWTGEDFVLIGPGEELREEYFVVPATRVVRQEQPRWTKLSQQQN